MNQPAFAVVTALLLGLSSTQTMAIDRLSVGIGGNYLDNDLYDIRLGLQWLWDMPLWQWRNWQLGGYWEVSYNYLRVPDPAPSLNHDTHIWAITPVFVLAPRSQGNWSPYIEVAIGAAYLSDKEIAGRATGSHYQFEDRASLGVRFGQAQQYDVNLRFMHYSNANIESPNPGYDLLMLNFTLSTRF